MINTSVTGATTLLVYVYECQSFNFSDIYFEFSHCVLTLLIISSQHTFTKSGT